ncbi:MAG TPA: helix-turn-helix transcriptional regulator [Terriglobia bacterium]|nr:helix-turn-helix transcriptional regulator [Terriglobia bacterium]
MSGPRCNGNSGPKGLALLDHQEFEIVQWIVTGYSNRDIAQELDLTEPAVRHQLSHILEKLGVANRLELALYAVNYNLSRPFAK